MTKKYKQIQDEFEKAIHSGKLEPGARLPTEEEICVKYSVSRSTAAKALNELLSKNLVTRHPRKGTFVKKQEYNKTGIFCILEPSLMNDTGRLFTESFTSFIASRNRTAATMITGRECIDRLKECVETLNQTNCAGIAIHPSSMLKNQLSILEIVSSAHCPVVVYYRTLAGFKGIEVIIDEEQCTELAVKHLIDLGHRRLAFAGVNIDSVSNTLRYKVFCNICANTGIDYNQFPMLVFQDPFQIPNIKNCFCNPDAPTALVAVSEYHAFLAYDILTSLGLKIPEDVAIVTLDGSSISAGMEVPFTTVEFPAEELGRETAQIMYKISTGEIPAGSHFTRKLSGRLVIRNSCGSRKMRRHEYLQEYLPDLMSNK